MDLWGWLAGLWASVEPRTDWVAVVTGFLGTIVAVIIALGLQRRDFRKRATEAAEQNIADAEQRRRDLDARKEELAAQAATDARQRRDDWRRNIVAKAFDVLNDAEGVALRPYLAGERNPDARADKVRRDVDSMLMEFRLDAEPGGNAVGEWFMRTAKQILASPSPDLPGLMARARFDLTEWVAGSLTNESFQSK